MFIFIKNKFKSSLQANLKKYPSTLKKKIVFSKFYQHCKIARWFFEVINKEKIDIFLFSFIPTLEQICFLVMIIVYVILIFSFLITSFKFSLSP